MEPLNYLTVTCIGRLTMEDVNQELVDSSRGQWSLMGVAFAQHSSRGEGRLPPPSPSPLPGVNQCKLKQLKHNFRLSSLMSAARDVFPTFRGITGAFEALEALLVRRRRW